MKRIIEGMLYVGVFVMSAFLTGCDNDDADSQKEQETVRMEQNVKEGYSKQSFVLTVPADTDHGTGEYEEEIIQYKIVGENSYVGPKDYIVLPDEKIVIYDQTGEQIVIWQSGQGCNFYSVKGYNVEGLYYDGEDILLRCKGNKFLPVSEAGVVSSKEKENLSIAPLGTAESETLVQAENKYVQILRTDREGNFYTHEEVFLPEAKVIYFEHYICKYDAEGSLLGYAVFDTEACVAEPDHLVVVSENGSIYRMECKRDGVTIYKVTLGDSDKSYLTSRVQELEKKEESQYIRDSVAGYNPKGETSQSIRDVLLRDKEFFDTDNNGEKTKLSQYKLPDGMSIDVNNFSVVDIDKDGFNEVIIELPEDMGVEIFKDIEGTVYSYSVVCDNWINVDGIMTKDNCYFVPEFTKEGYSQYRVAWHDSSKDKFYIGSREADERTFAKYKADIVDVDGIAVKYYDITLLDRFAECEESFAKKYKKNYVLTGETPEEIVNVLLYDGVFVSTDENNKLTKLSEFKYCHGEYMESPIEIYGYIVVDIDKDGYNEVIAYLETYSGDVEVFHYEDGAVYGYQLGIRSVLSVSPEGVFRGSSGASSDQSYILVPNKDKYTSNTLCETDSYKSEMIYYVDGEVADDDTYVECYDSIWEEGELQKYETLLMLVKIADKTK